MKSKYCYLIFVGIAKKMIVFIIIMVDTLYFI